MTICAFSDSVVADRRVLIREDFNVPLNADGTIAHEARIVAALPTMRMALEKNAHVMVMSHLGRPEEGHWQAEFSLAPVAKRLEALLKVPVIFEKEWLGKELNWPKGSILFCENTRFCVGEKKNDPHLARAMAALCDVFVMDAFAVAHRAEASTVGVATFSKEVYAGPLLAKELSALSRVLEKPKAPVVAIVGGSKVSTKLGVLKALLEKVDVLILGGGIANTFLLAEGHAIGASLAEADFVTEAQQLLRAAKEAGKRIWLPMDVRVATTFDASAMARVAGLNDIASQEMILDIGPQSEHQLLQVIQQAQTILWNGPLGVFEFPAFASGTRALAEAIGESNAYTVAGGGDTLSAIDMFGITEKISYISTGGGAFLELVEGKLLPGIKELDR